MEELENVLFADGFDEAFIGIAQQFNTKVAVYDRDKCIEILMKDMSFEEAEEYFEFNIQGAYVGETTPIFLYGDHYYAREINRLRKMIDIP